ncbi:MAG TPA: hypothetical protein PKA19_06260 [Bacillota bacterium]|nr:hypothetical protein [Bacillota bacterium]
MKTKEPNKTIKQYAAEVIAENKVWISGVALRGYGEYDGVGLEWKSKYDTEKITIKDILGIDVIVFRSDEGRIRYFVEIETFHGVNKTFSISHTVEEAFAIKDLLDDMIAVFKIKTTTSAQAGNLPKAFQKEA